MSSIQFTFPYVNTMCAIYIFGIKYIITPSVLLYNLLNYTIDSTTQCLCYIMLYRFAIVPYMEAYIDDSIELVFVCVSGMLLLILGYLYYNPFDVILLLNAASFATAFYMNLSYSKQKEVDFKTKFEQVKAIIERGHDFTCQFNFGKSDIILDIIEDEQQ